VAMHRVPHVEPELLRERLVQTVFRVEVVDDALRLFLAFVLVPRTAWRGVRQSESHQKHHKQRRYQKEEPADRVLQHMPTITWLTIQRARKDECRVPVEGPGTCSSRC